MNGSSLTYAQISEISANLKTYATNMEDALGQIKSLYSKVGQDTVWAGTAAEAAKENFDKLSAKFPDFVNAVNECSDYLNTVVANYQAADTEVSGQSNIG